MSARGRDYTVRGYSTGTDKHRHGDLLLETTHATKVSKDIEVAAWQSRMKKGEVAYVEVISHVEPYGIETLYR